MKANIELERLIDNASREVPLELWGPYVSERQWATVREDYSANGDVWNYFLHDHARSRAYLWGEDGIAAISDCFQNICFGITMWNEKDTLLKERLFGLNNQEGNHGEDVKELYYYLDNVPSHYYMKYLYKYPQAAFPYEQLIEQNQKRDRSQPEFEILDTGVFNDGAYFDVFIEYAKVEDEDILIRISITNQNANSAPIIILPTTWFYNKWQYDGLKTKPQIKMTSPGVFKIKHENMGNYYLYYPDTDEVLFTDNETNFQRLFGKPNKSKFVKDGFHEAIIRNNKEAVNSANVGTKASPVYRLEIESKQTTTLEFRLSKHAHDAPFSKDFESVFELRKQEAKEYYKDLLAPSSPAINTIKEQALNGILWNRQFYYYDIEWWLNSTDGITPITPQRKQGRNKDWKYLKNKDVLAMPDKWEFPWYAAWDTAFQCITIAMVDPVYAKHKMLLLMREWYMNPKGQLPAYEWDFNDVNPPVHAFAALEIYRTEKSIYGKADVDFLKLIFQKLIINFTWWVNLVDHNGNNIFEGGFLGLDNIGIFNRNAKLGDNIILEQSDGTSWMGMYALNMMEMALEIALTDSTFEDAATKFYEHFVIIGEALNELDLWNEEDQFFYDVLFINQKDKLPLRIRSVVGMIPLFAVTVFDNKVLDKLPDFLKRMKWFEKYRNYHKSYLPNSETSDQKKMMLSMVNKEKLCAILTSLLDESEFLSDFGIRSLSRYYKDHPYQLNLQGVNYMIEYDPGESTSDMYGGNSNWRGPIWMPLNYLLIKSLYKYADFYQDSFQIEFPVGSGDKYSLENVAFKLTERLVSIFTPDNNGDRPVYAGYNSFYNESKNELILFHEYFHGDTGMGLGASHQTGWTALIVNLIEEYQQRGGKNFN